MAGAQRREGLGVAGAAREASADSNRPGGPARGAGTCCTAELLRHAHHQCSHGSAAAHRTSRAGPGGLGLRRARAGMRGAAGEFVGCTRTRRGGRVVRHSKTGWPRGLRRVPLAKDTARASHVRHHSPHMQLHMQAQRVGAMVPARRPPAPLPDRALLASAARQQTVRRTWSAGISARPPGNAAARHPGHRRRRRPPRSPHFTRRRSCTLHSLSAV